jgi:beta-barrel assembly-enhancing protease
MNIGDFRATVFHKGGGDQSARLKLDPSAIHIEAADGSTADWPYRNLRMDPVGDEDAYLLLQLDSPDSSPFDSVTLRDPDFIKSLASRVPTDQAEFLNRFFSIQRQRRLGKWRSLILAGFASIALILGGYWVITFYASEWAAKHLPIQAEEAWGDAMVRGYTMGKRKLTEGPAYDAATFMFERLIAALPEDQRLRRFTLHVLDDPMVNAFALPGGHVALMTGLMRKADSEAEVAGVLAHEIQHVTQRHVVKRLVQSLGWRAWFSLFFGGGDLASTVSTAGGLLEMSYGREQEREADRYGAELLLKAGYPVEPMAGFFEKLAELEHERGFKMPSFLSTHPESLRRAHDLKTFAAENPIVRPTPTPWDWEKVRESLK